MPVGPCCGEEQEAVLPEVVHPDPYVGDDQLEVIERRIDAFDVRLARLQELEQRVASLEKFCGCEAENRDGKDANDGIIMDFHVLKKTAASSTFSKQDSEDVEAIMAEASFPTCSQAINPDGLPRSIQLLQESFWDAIFVLGLGGLGVPTTLLVTIGTLVSICSQSLFCWIVFVAFLLPDAKYDPAWLVDWRLLVGHAVNGYDANSDSSLVSRACRGKPFEREWWTHALLNEIDDYLTPLLSEDMTVGSVLSSMAVAIWLAYIAKELQRVGDLTMNLLVIPSGPTLIVDMDHVNRKGGMIHAGSAGSLGSMSYARFKCCFVSMSRVRMSLLLVVLAVRAALAALLGFCGALWLCRTRDVENIIQNGVSLVFVLEIDELFFELFAPHHASRFVTSVARVENQTRKAWAYNLASSLQLLAFLGVVVAFVSLEVVSNTHSAREVRDIICSGNQDFIIESHTKVGPIFVTDTSPFEDGNLDNKMLPGMLPLLREVSENYKPGAIDWMWRGTLEGRGAVAVKHTPTVRDFNGWLTMDQFQVADQSTYGFGNWFGNSCKDQGRDFWEGDWLWSTATALTGATDCASAEPFCGEGNLPLIRMLCPETCKCSTAIAGQFLSNGCRLGCKDEPGFMNVSCEDFGEDDVEKKEAWDYYWGLFYTSNKGLWQEDHELMVFAKNGSQGNCSVLKSASWMRDEFCFHYHNDWVARRPLTAFCPETCGCLQTPRPESSISTSIGSWCPSTC